MKKAFIITIVFSLFLFGMPKAWKEKSNIPNTVINYDNFTLRQSETGEIISLTPEEYLIGCLYAQIPPTYHMEMLKAQAIAAHSYALRFIKNNRLDPGLDGAMLTDDAKTFQSYYTEKKARDYYGEEYDFHYNRIKEAAEYGAQYVILNGGEPIYGVYHNTCAGATNTAASVWGRDFPYLKSVNSNWDKNNAAYLCQNEFTVESLRITLLDYDPNLRLPEEPSVWFTGLEKNESGYVETIRIGDRIFSGGDVWRILNLRSPAFTVTYTGTVFSFETEGLGHGVGLSQYGGDYLASRGYTAEEILNYYFTNILIYSPKSLKRP